MVERDQNSEDDYERIDYTSSQQNPTDQGLLNNPDNNQHEGGAGHGHGANGGVENPYNGPQLKKK